ncbi:MAG: hypothetical protein Kow0079_00950 [Vicingaceae bacterium]
MNKLPLYNKVIVLGAILLLPSFFYFFLYSGEYHYKRLPILGPKEVIEKENGKIDTLYHTIPSFKLINQKNETITEQDLLGNIVVADFFFVTCPSICPKMTTNLKFIQDKFKERKDFKIVSFTVNPEHDTVEVLADYAKKVHADESNWSFATGPKKDIYDLAFNGFFVSASRDSLAPGGFLHSGMIILLDKKGRIRGYFDGTVHKTIKEDLVDAIDILYKEEFVALKEKP